MAGDLRRQGRERRGVFEPPMDAEQRGWNLKEESKALEFHHHGGRREIMGIHAVAGPVFSVSPPVCA
jgi:hypothetical protein